MMKATANLEVKSDIVTGKVNRALAPEREFKRLSKK
jgi:hypothetical protein